MGGFCRKNLRIFFHSQFWISFGPVFNHIFISPAQHQIHHSVLPQHRDRNMGAIFAFWDYFFGRFYIDPLVNSVHQLARSIRGQQASDLESTANGPRG
jgi:sterol desaturase/sphingolipid hydroxylase (fatty acid hydroxylase superfamily)